MSEGKHFGISKTVFIVGLIIAILASSLISAAAVTMVPMLKGPFRMYALHRIHKLGKTAFKNQLENVPNSSKNAKDKPYG